ncbi:MAG: zinc ribbon domain-containing protein [Acidobacteria bacterium]|nr:zinc ribbon domain-containing protein [Acidobacteriota bacterium]MBI3663311.1 zinc ribbon domain-containing protein [Acidobacteriota bacterium]
MLCDKCGKVLAQYQKFCPECGQAVPVAVSASGGVVQPEGHTPPTMGAQQSARNLLIIICIILAIIAIATLHGFAATLAVICITVAGFTAFTKSIPARKKLYGLGIALVAVLVTNGIEGWQEEREEHRRVEIARQQAAQRAAAERKKEEAFIALSDAEHLDRAKALLNANAATGSIGDALKHLGAITPSSPEAAEGEKLKKEFGDTKRRQAREAAKAQAAAAQKKAAAEAQVNRVLRDAMAKTIENKLLDDGYNVDAKAIGPDHTILQIKWILASKVLAHHLSKEGDFFDQARRVGFKRIEITDGYEETWYWNLK